MASKFSIAQPMSESRWGEEAAAAVGEGIFNLGRDSGVEGSGDEAVFRKCLERCCEHLLGYVRDASVQVVEAHSAFLLKGVEHEHRPFVAYS